MNPLHALHELGQAVWLDAIRRSYLDEGGYLDGLIGTREISGLTSNPSIFAAALASDDAYTPALGELAGADAAEAFWSLITADTQAACDRFLPLWHDTAGLHGHVSLEVHPSHADDTEATVSEALLLSAQIDRPNLMVKVPATEAGLSAVTRLLAEGISVNVTLLFSVARYEASVDAFLAGLRRRAEAGGDLSRVTSVASFFVSRFDGKVDPQLAAGHPLRGSAGIANARAAYATFRELSSTERFAELAAEGARVQRPLWASTSTKDPAYPDTMYVDALAGPDTVNTMPEATLDAVREGAQPADRLTGTLQSAQETLGQLAAEGVDLGRITEELEAEGIRAFARDFDAAVATIGRALAR